MSKTTNQSKVVPHGIEKIISLPKKSGGTRTIYVVKEDFKESLQDNQLPFLQAIALLYDKYRVSHGFTPCRSPVTNALRHVGYQWSVSFDLQDFFDHTTEFAVAKHLPSKFYEQEKRYIFPDGAARQGLPTSPSLANIALIEVDERIYQLIQGQKLGVYTRYADDLTISANDRSTIDLALRMVPQIVESCGFKINTRKTYIQSARKGRRIITGIAVDDHGIHPTRKVKRKLRAATHQGNRKSIHGLKSWCSLKQPSFTKWLDKKMSKYRHIHKMYPDSRRLVELSRLMATVAQIEGGSRPQFSAPDR